MQNRAAAEFERLLGVSLETTEILAGLHRLFGI